MKKQASIGVVALAGVAYLVAGSDSDSPSLVATQAALTCSVRVSAACQKRFGLQRYDRVSFGMADSKLPPTGGVGPDCVEVLGCTAEPCVANNDVCLSFAKPNPYSSALRWCVRRNSARGFGECRLRNGQLPAEGVVYNVTQTIGKCELLGLPVGVDGNCYIIAGDRAEDL